MKKALYYLLGFALMQFFLTWAVYAVWLLATGHSFEFVMTVLGGDNAGVLTSPMFVSGSAVSSAGILGVFLWRRWAVVSQNYLRTRPWDVFFWCVVASLGTLIPSVWLQELLPDLPDSMAGTFKMVMSNDYGYFVLCLLAPLAEEVVFRGAILRALLGCFDRHWIAILVSAAIFSLIHLNPVQMPHAFLWGLFLGWMYYRTGSILPGVLAHWVNNTVAYVVYVLYPPSADMTLSQLFGGNQNSVVLSLVFSLFILLPGIYQLNMRMKR